MTVKPMLRHGLAATGTVGWWGWLGLLPHKKSYFDEATIQRAGDGDVGLDSGHGNGRLAPLQHGDRSRQPKPKPRRWHERNACGAQ